MKPLDFWRLEQVVYARPTPPQSDASASESDDEEDEESAGRRKSREDQKRRFKQLAPMPYIKEVIRYPKEDPIPLGQAGKKRRAEKAKDRSQSRKPPEVRVVHEIINRHYDEEERPERAMSERPLPNEVRII